LDLARTLAAAVCADIFADDEVYYHDAGQARKDLSTVTKQIDTLFTEDSLFEFLKSAGSKQVIKFGLTKIGATKAVNPDEGK
jgi:hypothetical protein